MERLSGLSSGKPERRGENKAFSIITVTAEGDLSTFSPELAGMKSSQSNNFIFGNVDSQLSDILGNREFNIVLNEVEAGIKRCEADCQFYSVCGGGSPSNKLHENGSFVSTETLHCKFHTQMFCKNVLREFSDTR